MSSVGELLADVPRLEEAILEDVKKGRR